MPLNILILHFKQCGRSSVMRLIGHLRWLFFNPAMLLFGMKRSLRRSRRMSVAGGKAEMICSVRVFRILTHSGHAALSEFLR